MASCGAGAPHRPGGAARLPPFSCLSPEVPDDSLPSPPLPADAFPRPFFVRLHAEEAKACEGRRGKRYGLCPGRGSAQGRPGRGGRAEGNPKAGRRNAAEQAADTPQKDEKRPRPPGTKKDPQCRNPALRVFVGRSGRGAAVNSWLPRSYAFRKRRRPKNGQDVCSGTRPSSRGRRTGSCAAR